MPELQLLIFTVIGLALLFDFINGFHDTVGNVFLQDQFTRIIHRGFHRRELDQHLTAVPVVLHHGLDGLEMPDGPGKPVQDRLFLRVRMNVMMAAGAIAMTVPVIVVMVSFFMTVSQAQGMKFFVFCIIHFFILLRIFRIV